MKNSRNLIIVVALTMAIVAVFALKQPRSSVDSIDTIPSAIANAVSADTGPASPAASAQLPRLLALGADQCVPCKMMQPGLAALRDEYADRFVTEFIDV
jgi:thioredoxin 1